MISFSRKRQCLGILCLMTLVTSTAHLVAQEELQQSNTVSPKEAAKNPPKIDHEIIKILDGKSWGLHGEVLGVMYQVIARIRQMLYGVLDKTTKTRVGMYEFEGKMYSILLLAQLESQLHAEFLAREQYLNNASIVDFTSLESLRHEYAVKKSQLNKIHVTIKEDFKNTTKTYVEAARGFKEQMLILIKESCKLRGKEKCFLLKWAEAPDGRETEYFENDMTTFGAMAEFFEDLVAFLEDLFNSCEKGREQFKQIMSKAQQKRNKSV